MAGVTGSISIKDNASSVLRGLRSEQAKLRSDAKKTDSVLKSVWEKPRKLKVAVSEAKAKVKSITSEIKKLKPVSAVIKAKDTASSAVRKVKGGLDAIGRRTVSPVIKVIDKASAKIKGISSSIGKLAKAAAIPIAAVGAAGGVALGGTVAAGMQLEQQQISIEHFVGATNKDLSQSEVKAQSQSYIAALRENANATPFETGDVVEAGSRAVALAGGDTKSAMQMVELAEDMAAASGGTKSIMDAMEALGDLKVGETERLKEFGFKVSADEFKSKGFEGVSGELTDFYGGAAGKLAGSGAGLLSTITGKLKSNAADFGLGVVEQLKPVLSDVIGLIDQAQPALQSFSGAFGQGLSGAISAARGAFEQLSPVVSSAASVIGTAFTVAAPLLQQAGSAVSAVAGGMTSAFSAVGPAIEAAAPVMEQAGSVISAVAGGMSSAFGAIAPVIGSVVSGIMEKIGGVVSFLSERAGFIQEVISTVGSAIATVLSTAWSVASPVLDMMIAGFELVFSVVQKVWPGISSAISAAWKAISPVFDAIAKGAEMVGGAFKKVTGFLSGKGSGGGKAGRNARGDNNWRGGPTWVGEEGPELIDLPRGTRILPHKESVVLAAAAQERQAAVMEQPVPWSRGSTENAAAGPGAGAFPEVKVGRNARGDNSWRGGPTWVGENGPELIDLPRGTRILPHKESVIWASSQEERTVPKEGPRTAVREQKKAVPERPAALTRSIAESTAEDLPLVRVGKNAHGDDNWHGGPTWVGEEGPELIGLPYGPEPLPRKDRLIRAAFMPERPAFAPKRRRFGTEQRMPWAENGFGRTEAKVGAAAFPVPEDMQKTYGESGRRGNIFSGRRKPLKRMETLQEAAEQMPDEAPVQESAKAHASVERMQPLWRQSAAVIGFQAALRELRHRQVRRAEPGVPGGMRSGRPRRNMLLQQSRALWQMPFLNGRETGLRGEQYRENWRRETGTSVWNSTASGNGAVRTEGTVPEPEGSPKAVPLYPKPEGNGWPAAKQTEQAETEDRRQGEAQSGGRTYHINISKIADSVTVQNAQDADELAECTAKKIIEALDNTA